jgi:hypothetical protein
LQPLNAPQLGLAGKWNADVELASRKYGLKGVATGAAGPLKLVRAATAQIPVMVFE